VELVGPTKRFDIDEHCRPGTITVNDLNIRQPSILRNLLGALPVGLRAADGILDRLPIGIAICDAEGALVQYNPRAGELWGQAPDIAEHPARYAGAAKVYSENGEAIATADLPMAEVLRSGQAVRDRQLVFERADGMRLCILANAEPLFDATGRLLGAVECFQDVTAVAARSAKAASGGNDSGALLEALPVAVYTTDADGRITFFNQAAAELWGCRPELNSDNDKWNGAWRLFWSDGREMPRDQSPMAVALKKGMLLRGAEAVAERPDGKRIPFMPYPTPLYGADGKLTGGVNVMIDISERKRAEERQQTLMEEINHRVKNTLSTVQALVSQTIKGAAKEEKDVFAGRLFALSRGHDLLARQGWLSADLQLIAEEVLAPYHGRIAVEGESLRLPPRMALTLTMVLHELAANALKHGALSVPQGKVALSWQMKSDRRGRGLVLTWSESSGPVVKPPQLQGFGTKLIQRSIVQELNGDAEATFDPAGVRFDLRIPMPPS